MIFLGIVTPWNIKGNTFNAIQLFNQKLFLFFYNLLYLKHDSPIHSWKGGINTLHYACLLKIKVFLSFYFPLLWNIVIILCVLE